MKAVGIGGAITAIIAAMLWQVHALLTPGMVFWLFMFLCATTLALLVSWGVTNAWKYDRWTYDEWTQELEVKRQIKRFARWVCAGFQLVANLILLLLAWPDVIAWPPRVIVAAVLTACMLIVGVCYWSPDLWKWVFKVLLPRINSNVRGKAPDRRYDTEGNPVAAPVPKPPADFAPDDTDDQDPSPPRVPA